MSAGPTPIWRLVVTARNRGESVYESLRAHGVDEVEARAMEMLAADIEPLYQPEPEDPETDYRRQLKHSGLPPDYTALTFQTFRELTPEQRARKMLGYYACRCSCALPEGRSRSTSPTSTWSWLRRIPVRRGRRWCCTA